MHLSIFINTEIIPLLDYLILTLALHETLGQRRRNLLSGLLLFSVISLAGVLIRKLSVPDTLLRTILLVFLITVVAHYLYDTQPYLASFFAWWFTTHTSWPIYCTPT